MKKNPNVASDCRYRAGAWGKPYRRSLVLACLVLALTIASLPARAVASNDPLADLEAKSVALLILNNSEFGVGFVVASTPKTSYLLTAAHVLGCGDTQASGCRDSIKVRFAGQLTSVDGRRVLAWKDQSDGDRDLALVQVDKGNLTPVPILSQTRLGADFYVIGYDQHIILSSDAFGGAPAVHQGSVSRIQSSDLQKHLNVWVPAFPGFSGGPIIDKTTDAVVGVFTGHLHATDPADIDYYGDGPALVLQFLTAARAITKADFTELSPEEVAARSVAGPSDSALSVIPAIPQPVAQRAAAPTASAALPAASAALPTQPAPKSAPPKAAQDVNPADVPALIAAAEKGDSRAQYALSKAYLQGGATPVDVKAGMNWCYKAVDGGYAAAETALGLFYADGRYVPRDSTRALSLLKSAAAAGEPLAQLNLGNIYHFGKLDTRPDETISQGWYVKAYATLKALSQNGDPDATWRLGNLYLSGTGLEDPDVKQGVAFLQRASDLGVAKASYNLAVIDLNGQMVEKNIPKGLDYLHTAERQGGADPAANLADIYLRGLHGQPRDLMQGTRYLKEAAERGNAWAMWRLGDEYISGKLVEKDAATAGEWLRKSSDQGNLLGETDYGLWLLEYAPSEAINIRQGLATLQDAANNKHFVKAARILGELYRDGNFVPRDPAQAFKYFQAASGFGGGPLTYYDLALSYELGQGTAPDPTQAKYWYSRSANLKYQPAITKLAALGSPVKSISN
jgi:TPR repeat protein